MNHTALDTIDPLGWQWGACVQVCASCSLLPTRIHPHLPVGRTVPQPTTSIHRWHPIHTSFLPSVSFLPHTPCTPSYLLRLLQCLPELWETYPPGHAWGHTLPIRLKKTHPNPSRQVACSHIGCLCVDVMFLCECRCGGMLRHPGTQPKFAEHKILLFSPLLTLLCLVLSTFILFPCCRVSQMAYIVLLPLPRYTSKEH